MWTGTGYWSNPRVTWAVWEGGGNVYVHTAARASSLFPSSNVLTYFDLWQTTGTLETAHFLLYHVPLYLFWGQKYSQSPCPHRQINIRWLSFKICGTIGFKSKEGSPHQRGPWLTSLPFYVGDSTCLCLLEVEKQKRSTTCYTSQ
jgi:hypothetical protein